MYGMGDDIADLIQENRALEAKVEELEKEIAGYRSQLGLPPRISKEMERHGLTKENLSALLERYTPEEVEKFLKIQNFLKENDS